jgi:hypothetical protein
MKIIVSEIDWEIDNSDELNLPKKITIEVDDLEDVAEIISDTYGFCVLGYIIEEV